MRAGLVRRAFPLLLLGAGVASLLASNAAWLERDHGYVGGDEAAHYVKEVEIAYMISSDVPLTLRQGDRADRVRGWVERHPAARRWVLPPFTGFVNLVRAWRYAFDYPPLVTALAVLPQLFAPADYDRLRLFLSCVFVPVLVLSVYSIGARLGDRWTGFVAGLATVGAPFVTIYSRKLLLDFPLAAMVSAGLASLLATESFSRRRASLAFGVVGGLGLLTKQAYPIFLAAPFFVALVQARLAPDWRVRRRHVGLAVLLAILVAGLYWIPQAPRQAQYLVWADRHETGTHAPRFSLASWTYYLDQGIGAQLEPALGGLALVGAAVAIVAGRRRALAMQVVACLLAGYAFFSLLGQKDVRFTLGLAGPLLALGAAGLAGRGPRAVRAAAGGLVCALALGCHFHSAWALGGVPGSETGLPWVHGSRPAFGSPVPETSEQRPLEEMLDAIGRHTPDRERRIVVLALSKANYFDYGLRGLNVRQDNVRAKFDVEPGQPRLVFQVVREAGRAPEAEMAILALQDGRPEVWDESTWQAWQRETGFVVVEEIRGVNRGEWFRLYRRPPR